MTCYIKVLTKGIIGIEMNYNVETKNMHCTHGRATTSSLAARCSAVSSVADVSVRQRLGVDGGIEVTTAASMAETNE